MNRGGLCDSCMKPGACCDGLALSGGRQPFDAGNPMSFEVAEHLAMSANLPFRPLALVKPDGDDRPHWRWWCTALSPEGRCTIYAERPQLCRNYQAGSDPLCVHHWPHDRHIEHTKAVEL